MKFKHSLSLVACLLACYAMPSIADPAPGADTGQTKSAATPDQIEHQKAADNCVRQVGSPTQSVRDQCNSINGVTAYDKSDIDSTGATNLGDAMTQLDPRISVSHR